MQQNYIRTLRLSCGYGCLSVVNNEHFTIKFEGFLDRADSSLKPNQINRTDYAGVFIGGGYGTLFDVASNQKLLDAMANIYERGGVIGSSGYGAGAFANVKLKNGNLCHCLGEKSYRIIHCASN
jgi:putative intracellular protease/amidase